MFSFIPFLFVVKANLVSHFVHFRHTNPLICICNITNSVCQSATWLFQHDINLSLLKKCCYINSKRVAKRELKTQRGQNISVAKKSQVKSMVVQLLIQFPGVTLQHTLFCCPMSQLNIKHFGITMAVGNYKISIRMRN